MSSSPLSSKNNTFVQSQAPYFNRQDSNLTLPMNANRYSPSPTSTTTRIVGPKPFYRSQVTPDPFDYTNNNRRQIDNQLYLQNQPQRRFSVNQMNANDNNVNDNDDDDDDDVDDDNDESISSDESLSIEFPPPPAAFSTPSIIDNTYQFVPVKNPFLPTTIGRSDSGSSLSLSYLSDHEPSSPTIVKNSHYPQYRSVAPTSNNYNNHRPVISVSASQSPLITIASRGSPNRSEIRFSPSPNPAKSTLREFRISRPDSPSIAINRQGITNPPMPYTNGNDNSFHISVGPPINSNQRDLPVSPPPSSSSIHMRGRTPSPFRQIEMHRDSPIDNRYTSNVVANRFKPLLAYTNLNSNKSLVFENSEHRSPSIVNLPPTSSPHSNSTPFSMRSGNLMKKDPSDVDHLTRLLMKSINSSNEPNFFGMCARCNDEIVGEENGLVAMDRMYHVSCFTCTMCGGRLRGMHFYSMENKPYCETCYITSLEKCVACARPITDRILRATGKPYHAECFCCVVCHKSLDGVPFTIDANMEVHCIDCFHQKFAPRCFACHRPILPINGQEETIRIVALDRNYHIDCYRCEKCKIQFTMEEGCYPIDDHVLCIQCNRNYTRTMLGHT
ncbi:unnamed protein product [Adineta steineri]|uniref:LIM zinc-binding domain-containing protein n=1 Tax=Adineta steineri TaxID=433720 RepID=A0A814K8E2_9BILA|nr:unnamed protein product [Adineta steineri]CAF1048373.1 unnamed protein product [Adineta steineri]CAF3555792.1 unnamed protein product [Adineta steineri]CAF3587948.1 unnamed protein product [Adineta steineri]